MGYTISKSLEIIGNQNQLLDLLSEEISKVYCLSKVPANFEGKLVIKISDSYGYFDGYGHFIKVISEMPAYLSPLGYDPLDLGSMYFFDKNISESNGIEKSITKKLDEMFSELNFKVGEHNSRILAQVLMAKWSQSEDVLIHRGLEINRMEAERLKVV
ncbi:hypothetical protein JL827_23640 [Vibrio parahaemolyticus]|nr:hypothetical protein [Vibrio parahaemolyticus]